MPVRQQMQNSPPRRADGRWLLRHASSGTLGLVAAMAMKRSRAATPALGTPACTGGFAGTTPPGGTLAGILLLPGSELARLPRISGVSGTAGGVPFPN
jgi:hypothetical protein